jgi:hypothetical protein
VASLNGADGLKSLSFEADNFLDNLGAWRNTPEISQEALMSAFFRSRGAAKLSESIHHQINAYTLAASAAGVGILALLPSAECVLSAGVALAGGLALSEPAEAKIVYTPKNVVIECSHLGCSTHRSFDLNHDGIPDFGIFERFIKPGCFLRARPAKGNFIEGQNRNASALKAAAAIDGTEPFIGSTYALMREGTHSEHSFGSWKYAQSRYLGVKFQIKGKTHYGWVRLKNSSCLGATLTGYAYETIPGKAIKAGQTHGADDIETNPETMKLEDRGPGDSMNLVSDKPQPVSLGILALGAQGVPLWRRKEEIETVK